MSSNGWRSERWNVTRRDVLRGAGVALALPWLETFAPRPARGAPASGPRSFIAMSFPMGVAQLWKPAATGSGDAWTLSPILEPLLPVKSSVSVLSNVGNYGPFGGHILPANSNLTAALLTATKAQVDAMTQQATVGTSVDQLIAQSLAGQTKLASLQVGLSTLNSSTDGLPPECSRSISWSSPTSPLFKIINPQGVFDTLVGAPAPMASDRRTKNKSILDYILAHATSVRGRVSRSDQMRMDGFMDSVRALEQRVDASPTTPGACMPLPPRPTGAITVDNTPPDYNRNSHAELMIDLVVMAVTCDVTRVVSFMLDDARSDFVYNFLEMRKFSATTSTPSTGAVGGLHGLTQAGSTNDGWATINRWFVEKLTSLCQKLQASPSGAGTVLDSTTIWFGSEMHGANSDALDLPIVVAGGGGGRLKTNQHVDFAQTARKSERLANLHLTFMKRVFDMPTTSFGTAAPAPAGSQGSNDFGAGTDVIPEILT
jgi:hypothetical protein